METVCQVAFNLLSGAEARKTESILREYLLRVADQVSMTRTGSSSFSVFKILPHPFRTKNFLRTLKEGDVAEKEDHLWTFNLTENIKQLLNHATLLFGGRGVIFCGFTDPKFMKHGNEIAYIISSEKLLTLYIPDSDKAELSNLGVYMDNPET